MHSKNYLHIPITCSLDKRMDFSMKLFSICFITEIDLRQQTLIKKKKKNFIIIIYHVYWGLIKNVSKVRSNKVSRLNRLDWTIIPLREENPP